MEKVICLWGLLRKLREEKGDPEGKDHRVLPREQVRVADHFEKKFFKSLIFHKILD